jgi:hypothetical protein
MKKLFTVAFLIIGISVNAQKLDERCRILEHPTGNAILVDITKLIFVDITKAKSEAGDIHKDFIIKATPAKGAPLIAITQKGTWWKGIYFKQKNDMNFRKGLALAACVQDDIKYGSFSLSGALMKKSYGVYIAEAKFLGKHTLYAEITNYKDLDENHNWTIEWNGNN